MRKTFLVLALGLFVSASAANACDGGKTCSKTAKSKKAMAACIKDGKCTMKDGKCVAKDAKASATAQKDAKCDMKAMKSGSHSCCKASSNKS